MSQGERRPGLGAFGQPLAEFRGLPGARRLCCSRRVAGDARLERLVRKLDRLRALDPDLQQLGALEHEYRLHPTLSEQALAAFEREHGLTLPAEYRLFLAQAGNGGSGPGYGLVPLVAWRPELRLVGKVAEFDGDELVRVGGKPVFVDLGPRPEIDRPADPSRPFLLDGPWPRRDHDVLPAADAHPFDGCTLLSEMGDGYRTFLVVTGDRAGEVWEDDTQGVAYEAVRPTGFTFLTWYERWLDDTTAACRL